MIILAAALGVCGSFSIQAQTLPSVGSGTLLIHLQGDAGVVTNSAGVVSWLDQSPNAFEFDALTNAAGYSLAQPTLTNGPASQPVVHFNGNAIMPSSTGVALFSAGNSPLTVFTAFRTQDNASQRFLVNLGVRHPSGYNDTFELGVDTGTGGVGNFGLHCGASYADVAPTNTIKTNLFYVASTLVYATGTGANNVGVYVNGLSVPLTATIGKIKLPLHPGWLGAGEYPTAPYELDIGARNDSGSGSLGSFHLGDIGEVIIYQGALNLHDRAAVESYLGTKFSVTITAPPALSITAPPQGLAVTNGQAATFTVSADAASGETDFAYQWRQNATNLNNATNASLTIASAGAADVGSYDCVVSIPTATNTSAVAQLRLITNATLPAVASGALLVHLQADAGVVTNNADVTTWMDQSSNAFQFTAQVDNLTYFPPTYQIAQTGNPVVDLDGCCLLTAPNIQFFTNDNSPLTIFTAFIDRDNSTQRDLLNLANPPALAGDNADFFELGIDVALQGTGNYGLHRGSNDATFSSAKPINNNQFYVVSTVIASNGAAPNNIALYANGVAEPLTVFSGGGVPAYPGWLNAGDYNTNGGTLNIGARLNVSQILPDALTDGGLAEVIVYQGQLSPHDRATVESYLGAKYGVTITAPATLSIVTQPQSLAVSNGQPANFFVAAVAGSGETDFTYQWQLDGTNITGEISAHLNVPAVSAANLGAYTCVVSIPTATNASAPALLRLIPAVTFPSVTSGAVLVHLTADAGVVTNALGATSWMDQSSNGFSFVAQGPPMEPPTPGFGVTGNPVLHFGGDAILTSATNVQLFPTSSSALTVLTASSTQNNAIQQCLVNAAITPDFSTDYVFFELGVNDGGAGAGTFDLHRGDGNATLTPGNTISNNVFYVMSAIIYSNGLAPGNVAIYANGTSLPLSASFVGGAPAYPGWLNAGQYPTVSVPLNIGARQNGGQATPNTPAFGDIGEVIIYQGALSLYDRAQVESYLGAKYGVTVAAPPQLVLTEQPASLAVGHGQPATLTVAASASTGETDFSYEWQEDGTNIAGALGASFTIPAFAPTNAGLYDCVVSIPSVTVTSVVAQLRLLPDNALPPVASGSLLIHLSAETNIVVTNGNQVPTWYDQSSNQFEFDAQADYVTYFPPTLTTGLTGNPVLHFEDDTIFNSAQLVQFFQQSNSPLTIITAFSTLVNNAQEDVINLAVAPRVGAAYNTLELGPDAGGVGNGTYGVHRGAGDATFAPATSISANQFYVVSTLIKSNGAAPANMAMYRNGVSLTMTGKGNSGSLPDTGWLSAGEYPTGSYLLNIGGRNDHDTGSLGAFFQGDLAEVIIYQGQLSPNDLATVQGYLGEKYGVASLIQPPFLTITNAGGAVVLTYPSSVAGFVLQYATNLSPANWMAVAPAPVLTGSQYAATNQIHDQQMFYRLIQP